MGDIMSEQHQRIPSWWDLQLPVSVSVSVILRVAVVPKAETISLCMGALVMVGGCALLIPLSIVILTQSLIPTFPNPPYHPKWSVAQVVCELDPRAMARVLHRKRNHRNVRRLTDKPMDTCQRRHPRGQFNPFSPQSTWFVGQPLLGSDGGQWEGCGSCFRLVCVCSSALVLHTASAALPRA